MSMLIDNLLKDITYGRKRLSILFSCLGYEGYETIQRTSLSGQRKVQQKLNQFNQPIQYYHIKSLQIFHESRQKNLDGNVFCDDTWSGKCTKCSCLRAYINRVMKCAQTIPTICINKINHIRQLWLSIYIFFNLYFRGWSSNINTSLSSINVNILTSQSPLADAQLKKQFLGRRYFQRDSSLNVFTPMSWALSKFSEELNNSACIDHCEEAQRWVINNNFSKLLKPE